MLDRFDRVVQRVPEQRGQIHDMHKIERVTVSDNGHRDPVLLTIQAFAGKDRIQDLVSGLVLRFIGADLMLQLVEDLRFLLASDLGPQQCDLMFKIMILLVDKIDGFLPLAEAFVLLVQDMLKGVTLLP